MTEGLEADQHCSSSTLNIFWRMLHGCLCKAEPSDHAHRDGGFACAKGLYFCDPRLPLSSSDVPLAIQKVNEV